MPEYRIITDSGEIPILVDDGVSQEDAIRMAQEQYPQYFPKAEAAPPNPFKQELVDKLGHDPFAELGDAPPQPEVMGRPDIPPEEQIKMMAMAGGGALGGAPGAAGSYALADQLLGKYLHGQEITPKGAATSLGTGALYEALPAMLSAYGRSNIGKWLYHKGVNFPSATTEAVQNRVTNYGYNNDLVVKPKTINQLMKRVGSWKKELTNEIQTASQNGVVVNPEQVIERARMRMLDEMDGVPFTGTQRAKINREIDKEVNLLRGKFGVVNNQAGDVSLEAAQLMKEKGQKYAKKQIERARKSNAALESPTQLHMIAAASDEYKKEIAKKLPIAEKLNKKMSSALEWRDFASDRLRKHGTRTAISHDITLPAVIELSTRGSLGVPTALGGLRYLTTHPTAMTRAGLLSKYLQLGASARPDGWMIKGFMDRNTGE